MNASNQVLRANMRLSHPVLISGLVATKTSDRMTKPDHESFAPLERKAEKYVWRKPCHLPKANWPHANAQDKLSRSSAMGR